MPRLRPDNTVLLIVDMQEKLQPLIADDARLRKNAATLAEGARLLDVPVVVTEQYPKGLAHTVPELHGALKTAGGSAIEKTAFSCPADPTVRARLEQLRRPNVLLAGVEAHICVLQTALDLIESGYNVHVVEDAVGSRSKENKDAGLARMLRHGVEPSTVEMALFELMADAKHPAFRDVQKLIK